MSTELYNRIMEYAKKRKREGSLELEQKVWNPTPWVVDVFMGKFDGYQNENEYDIRNYCTDNFGEQSWPIHDKPANWYRAGFTVDGWTWIGFKTEEMMKKFIKDWANNIKKEKIK